ncbi:MAG: hypothetical protein ACXVW4_03610 [Nocardioides sp.]
MSSQLQDHAPDAELRAAYARLATPAAPPDALVRVQDRIRARRRHRIAVAGGTAALALAVGGVVVAAGLSGDDPAPTVADSPTQLVSTLTFQHADGSSYTFSDLTLACRTDPESGRRLLELTSPRQVRGDTLLAPLLILQVDPAAVADGRTFRLPIDGATDTAPLLLFFATDEGGPRANELSSAEQSSGTVQVRQATCGATPALDLRVDATLGSEVEQDPMRISGEYRTPTD